MRSKDARMRVCMYIVVGRTRVYVSFVIIEMTKNKKKEKVSFETRETLLNRIIASSFSYFSFLFFLLLHFSLFFPFLSVPLLGKIIVHIETLLQVSS